MTLGISSLGWEKGNHNYMMLVSKIRRTIKEKKIKNGAVLLSCDGDLERIVGHSRRYLHVKSCGEVVGGNSYQFECSNQPKKGSKLIY